MRAITTIATVLLAATTATAQPPRTGRGQTRDDVDQPSLTAEQIARYARPYYPAIKACYFEFGQHAKRASGEMRIELVIHRNGYVRDVAVDAPGVRGLYLHKLEDCVRLQVGGWHFPVRRDFTTAVLPYYFMYLDLPGAGPQYSCWDPKGCLTKPAKRPRH